MRIPHRRSSEDKLKSVIREAVGEVLIDSDVLKEIITSITDHALRKQAELLREALDIIDERFDELNESVNSNMEEQVRLIESMSSIGTGMKPSEESYTEDRGALVQKEYILSNIQPEEQQQRSNEPIRLRNKPEQKKKNKRADVSSAFGIDIFEGIDKGKASSNHMTSEQLQHTLED